MSKLTKALTAAAGNAGGDNLYVEDVFSTYLYTGADANETVTNGIDLAGEGGFVWIKPRTTTGSHLLFDTERGTGKYLVSSSTAAEATYNPYLSSFNSDGFTTFAFAPADYASWTFRKAEKFFDVVTYTGDGVAGRTVAHNLGAAPGMIIVKQVNGTESWNVYHESMGNNALIYLNYTDGKFQPNTNWNNTSPTSTEFTVSSTNALNGSGNTYVAYLFASDAGGFGDDGSENIIKCGSYTTDGAGGATVNLGFEPQWVLSKRTTGTQNWVLTDVMRGSSHSSTEALKPDTSAAEQDFGVYGVIPTATGFINNNSMGAGDFIYIAIRRPMKTPESGTEVFSPSTYAGNDPTPTVITTGFPVDLALTAYRDLANAGAFGFTPRLTEAYLYSATTAAEVATGLAFDSNTSFATDANHWNQSPSNLIGYGFKRATGFMDVVAWTGNNNTNQRVAHNLTVAPELIIYKGRNKVNYWRVYSGNINQYIALNLDNPIVTGSNLWGSSVPTTTDFGINCGSMDLDAFNAIAYLFATVAGVSKVGSYTGTGAALNVDCGFSAGARFILIKRTDSTGDWYVWDSVRGIVAGNDPYLLLNSTAAEVTTTDYIDPLSSGFTVTSSAPAALNASGGTYIFLAIA